MPDSFESRLSVIETQLNDPNIGILPAVKLLTSEVRADAAEHRLSHEALQEKIDALIAMQGRPISISPKAIIGGIIATVGAAITFWKQR